MLDDVEHPSAAAWENLLQKPAISYPRCAPANCYWAPDLLEKWQGIHPSDGHEHEKLEVSSINYGSLLLLASYTASLLNKRLSTDSTKQNKQNTRIGLAIPEGPFLPLFVLAIHALNVTGSESFHPNSVYNAGDKCKDVVLIPLEADEAPERLRHILTDSIPDIILAAPGKDTECLLKIIDQESTIEVLDYTSIVCEALMLIDQHSQCGYEILAKLYSPAVVDTMIDSLRYSHALTGCLDIARLVAWGCLRLHHGLDTILTSDEQAAAASIDVHKNSTFEQDIMSHIVYTSGTTGKPKGCISSISSLQHYIRAKNKAHGVDGKSTVLLASAITFDPCFSDVLATFAANGRLVIASRDRLYGHSDGADISEASSVNDKYCGLTKLLRELEVTHVLCTPTLWATVHGEPPHNIPSLQVVALGGEPIPKAMRTRWARNRTRGDDATYCYNREYPRLFATYGVTEACVYQTCGEVFQVNNDGGSGQSVGQPLIGTTVNICRPLAEDCCDVHSSLEFLQGAEGASDPVIGEVVLSGAQVDITSFYLNLPIVSRRVFIESKDRPEQYFYRTGDLGYINATTADLHILGRIKGDGMVKVNGVRIEMAEIESALIDDVTDDRNGGGLIIDCLTTTSSITDNAIESDPASKKLVSYCIISPRCQKELRLEPEQLKHGLIVQHGALLGILRERCDRKVRKGCTPSFFVLIERLPLSPTGKRDRSKLPPLTTCTLMGSENRDSEQSLWDFGKVGRIVAEKVCECLNLQPCQKSLVTRGSSFFALGGDSLSATRVCRGLYASHHGVMNSRMLGGETGTLDGPFAAKHLLSIPTLGDYVSFLDAHSAFEKTNTSTETEEQDRNSLPDESPDSDTDVMYGYLIEAVALGLTCTASALLDLGVNPNKTTDGKYRLGKVKDRNLQRKLFRANSLHLACVRGEPFLVSRLLTAGCKANAPDAQGSFPIHLACSRIEDTTDNQDNTISANQEDLNRLECVKMLLKTTPISIKDGNKQTILHSAARSGHCELLKYIMKQWKVASVETGIKFKSHNNAPDAIYDWYDRWFRTPVHWAVLNKRIDALQVLLEYGCSAAPSKPKAGVSKRSTNVIIETPLEMCSRLYGDSEVGKQISSMLINAI